MNSRKFPNKALVLGRIGLVRSLGREGILVALAREGNLVFEKASRYVKEFICLPHLEINMEEALGVLEEYGARQEVKPVVFLNGESDVFLFSKYRNRLAEYFHIHLASHELIVNLIDKGKFGVLAAHNNLCVPKSIIPANVGEYLQAAIKIGLPCVLKPIGQRRWHNNKIIDSIGFRKALLINSLEELKDILDKVPQIIGEAVIQQYIAGEDNRHYDFHAYIDKSGHVRGTLVGQKIRTYPIHFGQGCYTHYVDEPNISDLCLKTLIKIGYTGAANINLKQDVKTGQYYILEINPRFSIWTIFDFHCGVNLPLLQYMDAIGLKVPTVSPHGFPRRWLWVHSDIKAFIDYRRNRQLSFRSWLRSYFNIKGKIEFHLFSRDDPLPLIAFWIINFRLFCSRIIGYIKTVLGKIKLLKIVGFGKMFH